MATQHIDSWMSDEVFNKQLSLNMTELSDINLYPKHWFDFINIIKHISEQNNLYKILDVGCGVGSLYKLCLVHLNNINYFGVDFSPNAISIAKTHWGDDTKFKILDYNELTINNTKDYDIIHIGAMLDVLPHGDEALSFFLKLGVKNLIIGRVSFTDKPSFSYDYDAYGKTFTRYKHNKDAFIKEIISHNYHYNFYNDTIHIYK